jgi:hypothetical protein
MAKVRFRGSYQLPLGGRHSLTFILVSLSHNKCASRTHVHGREESMNWSIPALSLVFIGGLAVGIAGNPTQLSAGLHPNNRRC